MVLTSAFVTYMTSTLMIFLYVDCSSVTINLDGTDWIVANGNKSVFINGTVPGSIYSALRSAGKIDDPYFRMNDDAYRDIPRDKWVYAKYLYVDNISQYQQADLIFEGVDTVADLSVNGKHVAQMNNMFRKYTFEVKSLLRDGKNIIKLSFISPILYAKQQSKAYPYDVPPDCPPLDQHGECHVNFIRKEASSFSWDWGPSFPTIGIWKSARLELYNTTHLLDFTAHTSLEIQGAIWFVNVTAVFRVVHSAHGFLQACVIFPYSISCSGMICNPSPANSTCQQRWSVAANSVVDRWYPNGHGEQPWYNLTVMWQAYDNTSVSGHLSKKLYFRTVELIQDPVKNSAGNTFYFKINGKPIFMKGSNWIPANSFQESITLRYLRKLLISAKEANMNMLRVWGGGVYESDEFYNLADELGIMIWQDFMFACALYPTNTDFLQNVEEEVKHQVWRLQMHPSIVVWAGNNENEGALALNWYGIKQADMPRYYDDYRKLYIDTIEPLVARVDGGQRPFVPSSPSNGVDSVKEGGVAHYPPDQYFGDVHYYNYSADAWNSSNFPTPRFASEFGFQSWPSLETLSHVSSPGDLAVNSAFTVHRQHHPMGNPQLLQEVTQHMNFTTTNNATDDFKRFVRLTQINQAVSIKTEAEHYRRMQSSTLSDGRGLTMGSLYWQLNDIWQAPTWAYIEYGGKWKMLHYFAKNFNQPILLSPRRTADDRIEIFLINDSLPIFDTTEKTNSHVKTESNDVLKFKPYSHKENDVLKEGSFDHRKKPVRSLTDGHTLILTMFQWSSMTALKTWNIPLKKQNVASERVFQANLSSLLTESGCPSQDHCFLYMGLEDCTAVNWLLLSNFTTAQGLQKANVQVQNVTKLNSTTLELTITSDVIAPFVWLDLIGYGHIGYFSDNGFIMVVPSLTLTFTSFEEFEESVEFKPEMFSVDSLMDVAG